MYIKNRSLLTITVLLLACLVLFYQSMVISEENAKECGVAMLNEFSFQISSDFESLTGKKYSGNFLDSSMIELLDNTYYLTWDKQTKLGEIKHVVRVGRFRLCPNLYGDISVLIPKSSSDIFEEYIRSINK